ncbi:hypothetical protein, partial [Plesiomonas shigelloides]|uniref:hypothetical protein n=1 Tax=Plesiomonas shigelloides TaxID=703 RepID=UPI003260561B
QISEEPILTDGLFAFRDFNVIEVLSSLLPFQRYSLFAFLSQLSLIIFSLLLFSIELNGGLVWV